MRVLLFSGSHSRHTFIHRALLDRFDVCGIVSMQRESEMPAPPEGIQSLDRELFLRHFRDRNDAESQVFGRFPPAEAYRGQNVRFVDSNELNTIETANFVKECNADIAVIFGVDLIKDPVMSVLPKDKINLHLGLSPWYRGSATLFWPFYFLEPQYAGATIHQIVAEADAGEIIHQTVPELRRGDGIHDVGSRTVVDSRKDLLALLDRYQSEGRFQQVLQKQTGRLFLSNDFKPAHLRVIYQQFENRVVDAYLDGHLGQRRPKLYLNPVLT